MLIDGPINIAIQSDDRSFNRELHIAFITDFHNLPLEQWMLQLKQYINQLKSNCAGLNDTSEDKQGMQLILQVIEPMMQYFETDEIPLDETITIEIAVETNFSSLINLSKH